MYISFRFGNSENWKQCKVLSIAGSRALTRERECISQPQLFFSNSLGRQWPFGPFKVLEKNNWGWDTSSLSLVSALLPTVVLNYLPQVLILCKLSNKLHQLHISNIWSMAQTITYIHIVELCSFFVIILFTNCPYLTT